MLYLLGRRQSLEDGTQHGYCYLELGAQLYIVFGRILWHLLSPMTWGSLLCRTRRRILEVGGRGGGSDAIMRRMEEIGSRLRSRSPGEDEPETD